MTSPAPEDRPFAPPSPALPPPTGAPRATDPPPAFATPEFPPPPPPPSAGRPRWLVPVIVGAAVLVLGIAGLVVAAAVQVGTFLRDAPIAAPLPDDSPDDPVAGDPGSPVADEPLDCVGCFTYPDATVLRLGLDAYRDIGLTRADGHLFSSYVDDEMLFVEEQWGDAGGDPAECYFTFPRAPLAHEAGVRNAATDDDRVHFPSWHSDSDERYWLSEGVRLFDDAAGAREYLAGLETAIAGCESYALPGNGWSANIAPAAALDLPASVAAYGWVETGGPGRYYVVDLQRGNLVLRLGLNSDGAGPTEESFREFAEAYAVLLAELEPSD